MEELTFTAKVFSPLLFYNRMKSIPVCVFSGSQADFWVAKIVLNVRQEVIFLALIPDLLTMSEYITKVPLCISERQPRPTPSASISSTVQHDEPFPTN